MYYNFIIPISFANQSCLDVALVYAPCTWAMLTIINKILIYRIKKNSCIKYQVKSQQKHQIINFVEARARYLIYKQYFAHKISIRNWQLGENTENKLLGLEE